MKVMTQFSMSLDGFIAEPNDDVGRLMTWYRSGDTDFPVPGTDRVFNLSSTSAQYLGPLWATVGAVVTGRGDFNASDAWGGKPPLGVPTLIVTHNPPPEWNKAGSPFIFVTDGVESAIAQAKEAAGDKHIAVSGTTIVQQAIRAGLLDELYIDLVPVLLGDGIRLFDHLGPEPVTLQCTNVVDAPGVTHLTFSINK